MSDYTHPDCMREVTRRARKAHACCECRRTIKAGDRYEYISGVWDGTPDSYKTCLRCVDLRAAYYVTMDGLAPLGDLLGAICERVQDSGRDWAIALKNEVRKIVSERKDRQDQIVAKIKADLEETMVKKFNENPGARVVIVLPAPIVMTVNQIG